MVLRRARSNAEIINAARSQRGGWTKETLAGWGVKWPPKHGWRKRLIAGPPLDKQVGPREDASTVPPWDDAPSITPDQALACVKEFEQHFREI
jgi:hypothetical protein